MRKIALILATLSIMLAACQGSTPQVEQAESTGLAPTPAAYAATEPATQVAAGEQATSTAAPEDKQPVSASNPGCTVRSPFPTPGPTEQSLFPAPSENDWVSGPDSAQITFIEYSDFQ